MHQSGKKVVAETWDKVYSRIPFLQKGRVGYRKFPVSILDHTILWYESKYCDIKSSDVALVVGAGGGLSTAIYPIKYGAEAVGFDISITGIKQAKRLSEVLHINDKCYFVVADMEALPFKQKSFSYIHGFQVLEYFNEHRHIFQGFYNCLKRDGKIFLGCVTSRPIDFLKPYNWKLIRKILRKEPVKDEYHYLPISYYAGRLSDCGFKNISYVKFYFLMGNLFGSLGYGWMIREGLSEITIRLLRMFFKIMFYITLFENFVLQKIAQSKQVFIFAKKY